MAWLQNSLLAQLAKLLQRVPLSALLPSQVCRLEGERTSACRRRSPCCVRARSLGRSCSRVWSTGNDNEVLSALLLRLRWVAIRLSSLMTGLTSAPTRIRLLRLLAGYSLLLVAGHSRCLDSSIGVSLLLLARVSLLGLLLVPRGLRWPLLCGTSFLLIFLIWHLLCSFFDLIFLRLFV